jgi:hypothetical protein
MKATWIDGRVLEWLAERSEGRVHSLFQQVCNLAWGDRLITLARPAAGRLPGGLTVVKDEPGGRHVVNEPPGETHVVTDPPGDGAESLPDSWPMAVGDSVRFDQTTATLRFPRAELTLTTAQIENEGPVPVNSVDPDRLVANLGTVLRLARLNGKGDLVPLLGGCAPAFGLAGLLSGADLLAWQELRDLARGLADGDGPALVAAARPLLGRGLGLTPAWDDLLLGLHAIAYFAGSALPPASQAALGELSVYLASEAPRRTTAISANYLWLAAKGGFSERLANAARSLLQAQGPALVAPLQQLLAYGQTSGHDTAVGLILGGATVLHLLSCRGGN